MVDGELKGFTKRVKDILSTVAFAERIKVLDFLNVSEQGVLESMVAKFDDVSLIFNGGFISAERQRAVIFPSSLPTTKIDPKVSIFKIEVIGTGEITHSQVLGSLMALNIDRSVIGDITVDTKGTMFAACGEFHEFLVENLTKVGRYDIYLSVVEEEIMREVHTEELEVIVSSMRLDVIVKTLINASRGKAEEYLDAGFVRLNHMVDKKPSRICHIGDILSIRKHGRFKIVEIKKTTKSGKLILVVSKSI